MERKQDTPAAGASVPDNDKAITAGSCGSLVLQDVWYIGTTERKNNVLIGVISGTDNDGNVML